MIKNANLFTEGDYRRLEEAIINYFVERHARIYRHNKQGLMNLYAWLRGRKYAKDMIAEIKSGKRICVAYISTFKDVSVDFMSGMVSREGTGLIINCHVYDNEAMTDYTRRKTLDLERALMDEFKSRGAVKVVAVSDVRDNIFINALETMDFEEINWGQREVKYGKRLSFTNDKEC